MAEPTQKDFDDTRLIIDKDTNLLESYWERRDIQMMIDRDVINLIQPTKKTDQIKWLSNEPKVFFDTSQSLISLFPPRFRLPMTINHDADEKKKMNKAERLCIGIQRTLDGRQSDTGGTYWMRDLAYWVLLGWYSVFAWVSKDEEHGVKFVADIWDPLNVYPQWDTTGLIKCARSFSVDKVTAISMAIGFQEQGLKFDFHEPPDKDGNPRVINYWRKTHNSRGKPIIENAISIAGQVIKPLTKQTKLDHIPIHVGGVGSPDKNTPNWEERRGEAITYGNRDMYKYDNIIFSLRAEILASQAFPNLVSKSQSGLPVVRTEDVRGHGTVLPLKLADQLELLRNAVTPQDATILEQYISIQRNKGSLPQAVYGSIPIELSGFAISQLLAAVRYKLGPYLNAMQSITSRVYSDFLSQYKNKNMPDITLSTENPQALKRGMTYIEEFSTEDVPEHIFVDVTIPINSQFDKTQAILNAVQAKNSNLLSRETLWEDTLDVQDTDQERERIRQDQVEEEPFILQLEIIEGLWDKHEKLVVEGKTIQADALKQHIFTLEINLGVRQAAPETVTPGVPSNQMPAEARNSPDQRRAATGTPPPGLKRRSQTPQERAASQGRRGVLVSPSGEPLS